MKTKKQPVNYDSKELEEHISNKVAEALEASESFEYADDGAKYFTREIFALAESIDTLAQDCESVYQLKKAIEAFNVKSKVIKVKEKIDTKLRKAS